MILLPNYIWLAKLAQSILIKVGGEGIILPKLKIWLAQPLYYSNTFILASYNI